MVTKMGLEPIGAFQTIIIIFHALLKRHSIFPNVIIDCNVNANVISILSVLQKVASFCVLYCVL